MIGIKPMRTTIKLFLPIIIALSITFTSTAQPTGSFISEEAQESCVKYCDVGIVLMVYHGEKNAATKTELSDYADWILTRSAELERMNGK